MEIDQAIERVLLKGTYVLGEEVENFERNFAQYIGKKYCAGVNSGTDALILSLRCIGVGPGDEVITTSLTASATVAAIAVLGAIPVFVDIDSKTLNIDVDKIEERISLKTKAVVAVHLYGNPCEMKKLKKICSQYNLTLIEDCAQANGSTYLGDRVGSFGDISCFSFYPTKNLGAMGDGGAILTSNKKYYAKIKSLRQYGWNFDRSSCEISGVSRLDEIQAAILNVKLNSLDEQNMKRRQIASIYAQNLDQEKFTLPSETIFAKHVYHLYVVRSSQRDSCIRSLERQGVKPSIHYRVPTHLQPAFYHAKQFHLQVTEKIATEIFSLPMFPELSEDTVIKICNILNKTTGRKSVYSR